MSDAGAGVEWVDTAEEEVVVVVTEDDTAAGRLEAPRPARVLPGHGCSPAFIPSGPSSLGRRHRGCVTVVVVCVRRRRRRRDAQKVETSSL